MIENLEVKETQNVPFEVLENITVIVLLFLWAVGTFYFFDEVCKSLVYLYMSLGKGN